MRIVSACATAGAANSTAAVSVAKARRGVMVMMRFPCWTGGCRGVLALLTQSREAAWRGFRLLISSSPAGHWNTTSRWFENGCLTALKLLERLARNAEAVDPGRHAGIDRDLEEDFLDLVLGEAVFQGRLDVQLQLMRAIEHADHRQIDDA